MIFQEVAATKNWPPLSLSLSLFRCHAEFHPRNSLNLSACFPTNTDRIRYGNTLQDMFCAVAEHITQASGDTSCCGHRIDGTSQDIDLTQCVLLHVQSVWHLKISRRRVLVGFPPFHYVNIAALTGTKPYMYFQKWHSGSLA